MQTFTLSMIGCLFLFAIGKAQSPIDPALTYPTNASNAGDSSLVENASFVLPTSDGGYLLVGSFEREGFGAQGRVVKVDQDGQILWQDAEGAEFDDHLFSATELNGFYYVVGARGSDPSTTHAWILRYPVQGGSITSRTININGVSSHFFTTIESFGEDRILIGGAFFEAPPGGSDPPAPETSGMLLLFEEDFSQVDGIVVGTAVHKVQRSGDGNYYVFAEAFRPGTNQNCAPAPKPTVQEKARVDDFTPGYYSDILVAKLDGNLDLIFGEYIGGNSPDIFVDAVVTPGGGFALLGKALCSFLGETGPDDICQPTDYFRPYWIYEGAADGSFSRAECLDSGDPDLANQNYEPFGLIATCEDGPYLIGYNQVDGDGGKVQIRFGNEVTSFSDGGHIYSGSDIKMGSNGQIIIAGNASVNPEIADQDLALYRFSFEDNCTGCPEPSLSVNYPTSDNCSADLQFYSFTFSTNARPGAPSAGTLTDLGNGIYEVSQIAINTEVDIAVISGSCTLSETVTSPGCACPEIAPPVSGGDVFICSGDAPEPLTVSVDTSQYTVDWYDTGGDLVGESTTEFLPVTPGDYFTESRLKVSAMCTSSERTRVSLVVHPNITVSVLPGENIFSCLGDTVNVFASASGGNGELYYQWSDGLGEGPGAMAVNFTPAVPGIRNITVTVTDEAGGCQFSRSLTITTGAPPELSRLSSTQCAADNQTYEVQIQSNAGQTNFLPVTVTVEQNGDIFTVSNIPVEEDLLVRGVHANGSGECMEELTVRAPDNCNCNSIDIPAAIAKVSELSICAGEPVPVLEVENPGPGFAVDWYENSSAEGEPILAGSLTFTPGQAGVYYAVVRHVASTCSRQTATPLTLTVHSLPVADAGEDLTVCAGSSGQLDAGKGSSGAEPLAYSWTPAGALQGANSATPAITPTQNIDLTLEVTDANGCRQQDEISIRLASRPVGMITNVQDISCYAGADGSLRAEVTGGTMPYRIQWSNNSTLAEISGLAAGNYAFLVTDENECKDTAFITLNQPDSLQVTSTMIDHIIGDGIMVTETGRIEVVVVGGVAPYRYQWLNDNEMVVSTEEIYTGDIAGDYQLLLEDANGCILRDTIALNLVGTKELHNLDRRIRIFPNPTSGLLTLDFDLEKRTDLRIDVLDATGRRVIRLPQLAVSRQQFGLDLGALPAGTYQIKFQMKEGYFLRSVIRL